MPLLKPFLVLARLVLVCLALPFPALAAPIAYALDKEATKISFETDFGQQHITGQIPPASADLVLDFDRVANCRIEVGLDVTRARASFPFAADAMKGPSVLDAANHPVMLFKSTKVQATAEGATVRGMLTIRGVTKPVTLRAQLFRPKGSVEGDRSSLTLRLTGAVSRKDYGATGFADLVGDEVRIIINARIKAKG